MLKRGVRQKKPSVENSDIKSYCHKYDSVLE